MKAKVLALALLAASTTTAFAQRYDNRNCDSLTGTARERCLNEAAYVGAPVTQQPGASGPGAVDKTHPGTERGTGPSPRDAGTSSAGSP